MSIISNIIVSEGHSKVDYYADDYHLTRHI